MNFDQYFLKKGKFNDEAVQLLKAELEKKIRLGVFTKTLKIMKNGAYYMKF